MNHEEIKTVLANHRLWLVGEGGSRADLSGANLSYAVLSNSVLSNSVLRNADLRNADLRYAVLSGADLSGAVLSGAVLSGAFGIKWASCGWADHGECGRTLLAVMIGKTDRYFCGCFSGSLDELREYIEDGEDGHKATRTIAADFCAARLAEMGGDE